ncbi:MAG: triacylglycerol lipase [Bradyrhizobium sp.]|jgi:triacylglycerol lipase
MTRRLTRWLLVLQILVISGFTYALQQQIPGQHPGTSLALSSGLIVTVRLLITASGFGLAWRTRSETPQPLRIGWYLAAGLFFSEFCASMISSSWNMAFFRVGKQLVAHPDGLPVLLIHGYGCNSGYWRTMSKRLSASNISHRGVDLEPMLASIDSYVPALAQAIEELARESHCEKVILVAHSMGGLISRAYLRDHGSHCVAAVITLGTPHHGTAMARHGIGINSRQMGCDNNTPSDWLQQLNSTETEQSRALFISIYSHHDNIVSPQLSAHLDDAINIALSGIGHVTLGMNRDVQQCVIAQIRRVAPPPRALRNK